MVTLITLVFHSFMYRQLMFGEIAFMDKFWITLVALVRLSSMNWLMSGEIAPGCLVVTMLIFDFPSMMDWLFVFSETAFARCLVVTLIAWVLFPFVNWLLVFSDTVLCSSLVCTMLTLIFPAFMYWLLMGSKITCLWCLVITLVAFVF